MPLTILIVEDHQESADSLAELLAARGHRVFITGLGHEAVEFVTRQRIDVGIIDIILPDSEGYTVAAQLRKILGARPLLIAATGLPNMDGWSKVNGFDHHFTKPIEPAALHELLGRYEDLMTESR